MLLPRLIIRHTARSRPRKRTSNVITLIPWITRR